MRVRWICNQCAWKSALFDSTDFTMSLLTQGGWDRHEALRHPDGSAEGHLLSVNPLGQLTPTGKVRIAEISRTYER